MQPTNTELPWTAEFVEMGGYDCMTDAWYIKDANGVTVLDIDCCHTERQAEEAKRRAAFIVLAVNSFEAMRQALADQICHSCRVVIGAKKTHDEPCRCDDARAALALAHKEQPK